MFIWFNGGVHDAHDPLLPAAAAGLTLGWGVFTTIGVWDGRPFALERHLARLRRDAAATKIGVAYSDAEIEAALSAVLRQNGVREGRARVTLTRRGDERWHAVAGSDLSILAAPATLDGTQVMRVALSPYRLDARRPTAGIKTTSYLDHQLAHQEAARRGFDETVVCDSQGALCECARANLFWVAGGQLHTPSLDSGCLPGIAREIMLEWVAGSGVHCRQALYAPQELAAADEVFITAATTGPRAVGVFYDGASPGGGVERVYVASGPVTQGLQERWRAAVSQSHVPSSSV